MCVGSLYEPMCAEHQSCCQAFSLTSLYLLRQFLTEPRACLLIPESLASQRPRESPDFPTQMLGFHEATRSVWLLYEFWGSEPHVFTADLIY